MLFMLFDCSYSREVGYCIYKIQVTLKYEHLVTGHTVLFCEVKEEKKKNNDLLY